MIYLNVLIRYFTPVLSLVIAYLLGSIPTSYLIGRFFFNTDIRSSGSGNTGATNALRTFGAKTGVIVLIIDILKGVVAVMIARMLMISAHSMFSFNLVESLSGLVVILGHVFSVFLKFKGGKGVATAAGVFFVLSPLPLVFCLVLFAYVVYTSKYVSLGSILAAVSFMLIDLVSQIISRFPNIPRLMLIVVIVLLILIRHRSNLKRLLEGRENKVVFRKKEKY
ncbi:MAG: glycerol-3-phosphate 1-O-acyltransferase PlsY [Candidatus Cloacimonetes bacterium]|nr:glycerol-3-phosphate 1-O-acyltransferase PlsY [Candidatus Cloacimonadota bacterium]